MRDEGVDIDFNLRLIAISADCLGLSLPVGLPASVNSPRLPISVILCLTDAVFYLVCEHVSTAVWVCKSTLHVNTPRHVITGTRPSPSLFSTAARQKQGWEGLGTRLASHLSIAMLNSFAYQWFKGYPQLAVIN